ncbi:MAG: DUF2442 domain-containing protein [Bacteroidetes bacterium]|nr:DUF2442 domain-containing protein [Bacteroidota bacterium]
MIEVINAKYIEDYRIWLEFNDGTSGIADLSGELWGRMFEPLRDVNAFKKFVVSDTMKTISWDNGADLAPEFLYNKVKNKHIEV